MIYRGTTHAWSVIRKVSIFVHRRQGREGAPSRHPTRILKAIILSHHTLESPSRPFCSSIQPQSKDFQGRLESLPILALAGIELSVSGSITRRCRPIHPVASVGLLVSGSHLIAVCDACDIRMRIAGDHVATRALYIGHPHLLMALHSISSLSGPYQSFARPPTPFCT